VVIQDDGAGLRHEWIAATSVPTRNTLQGVAKAQIYKSKGSIGTKLNAHNLQVYRNRVCTLTTLAIK
jgi:chorismate-pyruvate lyase